MRKKGACSSPISMVYIHIYVCIYIFIYTYMCAYVNTYQGTITQEEGSQQLTSLCLCVCIYIYIHTHIYVCVCVCVHMCSNSQYFRWWLLISLGSLLEAMHAMWQSYKTFFLSLTVEQNKLECFSVVTSKNFQAGQVLGRPDRNNWACMIKNASKQSSLLFPAIRDKEKSFITLVQGHFKYDMIGKLETGFDDFTVKKVFHFQLLKL